MESIETTKNIVQNETKIDEKKIEASGDGDGKNGSIVTKNSTDSQKNTKKVAKFSLRLTNVSVDCKTILKFIHSQLQNLKPKNICKRPIKSCRVSFFFIISFFYLFIYLPSRAQVYSPP